MSDKTHQAKLLVRKKFAELYPKIKTTHFYLAEYIKTFRQKHRIPKAALQEVGLSLKKLNEFQKRKTPILDMYSEYRGVDTLVRIMDLFGIDKHRLLRIAKWEERMIRDIHYSGFRSTGMLYGVWSNRWIGGERPPGPIRPSTTGFIVELLATLKEYGVEELNP